jgi:hypothetical protein
MKNHAILLFFLLSASFVYTQSNRSIKDGEWLLSVGVNTINSQGTKSPIKNLDEWAFRTPLSISAETKWSRLFSIEIMASINGYAEGAALDAAGTTTNSLTYYALDTSINYDFGEYIFPNTEWLDFYARAGLGYFHLDNGNISGNFGGGFKLWLTTNKSIGLKGAVIGKFALNHSDKGDNYANNHFQYVLQMVFRL